MPFFQKKKRKKNSVSHLDRQHEVDLINNTVPSDLNSKTKSKKR